MHDVSLFPRPLPGSSAEEPLYGKMDECGRSLFFTLSGTFLLSFAGDQDTADDAGQQQ